MGESWELGTLIDRGFYGSHIKICWVGLKGLECRMADAFVFPFFPFGFDLAIFAAAAAGARNVQEFTLQLLEVEIFFSWINFG